jgi:DNA-binding CsgD family transcriptional regulator
MSYPSYHTIFDEDWEQLRASIELAASYQEHWPRLIILLEQISAQLPVFIIIWNMMTNRIVYTTDKKGVIGYPVSKFLADDGVDFMMSNLHPEYVNAVITMQHEAVKYSFTKPFFGQSKTIVNLEGVTRRSNNKYFHFLQQTVCIEMDSLGHPFLFLSYVHDVSHIKKYGTANLVIAMPDKTKWWNFNFDINCLEPLQLFSKQEKRVVSFLAEGKCSKEIAEELCISPFTVDTHRKNLLRKTKCIDTTGMITYLRLVGLIGFEAVTHVAL